MSLSKLIRAPPTSISNLYARITSQQSSFPPSLCHLIQEMASKDIPNPSSENAISNQEYVFMMNEMVAHGNNVLKTVADKAEMMGSEEVYDQDVLDLCMCNGLSVFYCHISLKQLFIQF